MRLLQKVEYLSYRREVYYDKIRKLGNRVKCNLKISQVGMEKTHLNIQGNLEKEKRIKPEAPHFLILNHITST